MLEAPANLSCEVTKSVQEAGEVLRVGINPRSGRVAHDLESSSGHHSRCTRRLTTRPAAAGRQADWPGLAAVPDRIRYRWQVLRTEHAGAATGEPSAGRIRRGIDSPISRRASSRCRRSGCVREFWLGNDARKRRHPRSARSGDSGDKLEP